MSKELNTNNKDDGQIFVKIEPQEDNNNNTNFIVTHEQHLHSAIFKLLHSAVGGIGDERAFYYEDLVTYIDCEDGAMLAIEDGTEN